MERTWQVLIITKRINDKKIELSGSNFYKRRTFNFEF